MTPLERLDLLDRTKRTAFLALFAGARLTALVARVGEDTPHHRQGQIIPPSWGKAECEWVEDWHDFYARELPSLGLTAWTETDPSPAHGMAPGSTCWHVTIHLTDDGYAAREAWWDRSEKRLKMKSVGIPMIPASE